MNQISLSDCKRCFISKTTGTGTVIDMIHPITCRGVYGGQTLAECRVKHPDAEEMDLDEFCAWKAEQQRTPITWDNCTAESYEYSFGCLPPAAMNGEAFLVGEPYDHDAGNGKPRFQAYRRIGKSAYQVSSRPMTVAEFRKAI